MIGDTTVLITGRRGNGKSLKAVGLMKQEIAEGRLVFASNFNGLRVPGVQVLENPREWESLPPGSILFVDEAQRYWRSRRSGDPPLEVQAMETQRHLGITIVLLTQQPTYLDKHVRGLVDVHHHLILEVGGKASRMWTWKGCRENPDDAATRDEADQSVFLFPKDDFKDYDSAEVHTIKAKVPRKLKLVIAAGIAVVAMFAFAINHVKSLKGSKDDPVATLSGVPAVGGTPDDSTDSQPGTFKKKNPPLTPAEYVNQFRPRFQEMPFSAPAWDDRKVASDPQIFCMISGQGTDANGDQGGGNCRCMTEQGTRYAMTPGACRAYVERGGAYNPYKAPQEFRDPADQVASQEATESPSLSGGNGQPFGTLAAYGTLDAK